MFGQLYYKDLHEIIPELIVVLGLSVALLLSIIIGAEKNTATNAILVLPVIFVMVLAGLLPVAASFKLLSREWNNNTVYLIMSLPVSGTMIMLSKLAVLLTMYLSGTILAGLSGLALVSRMASISQLLARYPQLSSYTLAFYLLFLCGVAYLCCSSFLAQIIGQLSSKHSGLLTAAVFILIIYTAGRLTNQIAIWFDYSQSRLINLRSQIPGMDPSFLHGMAGASLTYAVIAVLLLILAIFIYNRRVEL
jgi:ABC-type transport system involved in multi-copper enzyme maturation permease subunit